MNGSLRRESINSAYLNPRLRDLEDARVEALEARHICGRCGKKCEDAEHLAAHILTRHGPQR